MKYLFTKRSFRRFKVLEEKEFDLPYVISGFAFIPNYGITCCSYEDDKVCLITDEGRYVDVNINKPKAIRYSLWNETVAVLADEGKSVLSSYYPDCMYTNKIGVNPTNWYSKKIAKVNSDAKFDLAHFDTSILITVDQLQCCVWLGGVGKKFLGGSKIGCNMCNKPEGNRMAFPQGVAVDSNGTVYVCDTGNGCIKVVKKNICSTIFLNDEYVVRPRNIRTNGKVSYYLDENKVNYMASASETGAILKSDNLIGIDVDKESNLVTFEVA